MLLDIFTYTPIISLVGLLENGNSISWKGNPFKINLERKKRKQCCRGVGRLCVGYVIQKF